MLPTQVASRDCSRVRSSSWAYASSLLSTPACWPSVYGLKWAGSDRTPTEKERRRNVKKVQSHLQASNLHKHQCYSDAINFYSWVYKQ